MADTRIAVAMSGGVDSAVTAYLLKQSGYDVIGMTLQLWPKTEYSQSSAGWVFPQQDLDRASRICAYLGIPFEIVNAEADFKKNVILPFCATYESGQTPNPCVRCNPYIKFGLLLDHAISIGAAKLATGHYACITHDPGGYRLFKAADLKKDQSYFLYGLNQQQLSRIIFPLYKMHKNEVKEIARQEGLPVPIIQESQDICFIKGDYREFIAGHVDSRPGTIVDSAGKMLGQHNGIPFYTIGQRHGLGISSVKPLYVTEISKDMNRIIVGFDSERYSRSLTAGNLRWISGKAPIEIAGLSARIRYKAREASVSLKIIESRVHVTFEKPQMAITPGQSIVFYRDNEVIGGGIIEKAG